MSQAVLELTNLVNDEEDLIVYNYSATYTARDFAV